MIWAPIIAFGLFFGNVNLVYFLSNWTSFWVLFVPMIILFVLGISTIKHKKLSTLLVLQDSINQGIDNKKLINDVSIIFMATLIALPGFFSGVVGLILFLPTWRKKITLWIVSLLHL